MLFVEIPERSTFERAPILETPILESAIETTVALSVPPEAVLAITPVAESYVIFDPAVIAALANG